MSLSVSFVLPQFFGPFKPVPYTSNSAQRSSSFCALVTQIHSLPAIGPNQWFQGKWMGERKHKIVSGQMFKVCNQARLAPAYKTFACHHMKRKPVNFSLKEHSQLIMH